MSARGSATAAPVALLCALTIGAASGWPAVAAGITCGECLESDGDACAPKPQGTPCGVSTACLRSACDGRGRCAATLEPAAKVCRAANGACDRAEYCTGTSSACPGDTFHDPGVECRAASGACDVAETCTGTGTACPADTFLPWTVQCRPAFAACDVAEYCTGTGAACPTDTFLPATVQCRPGLGACDVAEHCTGTGAACPTDAFLPSTVQCRAPAGACDAAEACTGSSASCPVDALKPQGATCRLAGGQCDSPETCSGASIDCPADVRAPDGVSCHGVSACVQGGTCESGVCFGGTPQLTFIPPLVTVPQSGSAQVRIVYSGASGEVVLSGLGLFGPFEIASAPQFPLTLSPGQETSVGLAMSPAAPGEHDGALTVAARDCTPIDIPLTGTVAEPPSPAGGGGGGGCGHGAGGPVALLAATLALRTLRQRTRGSLRPRCAARPPATQERVVSRRTTTAIVTLAALVLSREARADASPPPAPPPGGTVAATPAGKVYGALRVGQFVPTGEDLEELEFEPGLDFEVAAGLFLTPAFAAEVALGRFAIEGTAVECPQFGYSCTSYDLELGVTTFTASLRAMLRASDRFTLVGIAGGGMYRATVRYSSNRESGKESDSPFGAQLGVGLAYQISPKLQIGAEARFTLVEYAFSEETLEAEGVRAFAGASYRF